MASDQSFAQLFGVPSLMFLLSVSDVILKAPAYRAVRRYSRLIVQSFKNYPGHAPKGNEETNMNR